MTGPTNPLSEDEALKDRSRFLRGSIVDSLADAATGAVAADDAKLLKFHGSYQQDDRDVRNERHKQKLEPLHSFLIRLRMTGGICSPQQWLQLDKLARKYANASLRITTRQTFQFHGVYKRNLKATIAGINHALLNTIGACGDINRNVVCHNNPYLSPLHEEVYEWSRRLSDLFLPKTRAYYEIWLDEQPVAGIPQESERQDRLGFVNRVGLSGTEQEPFYGKTFLPRKFKIGVAIPPYNDIDVFAQDLGLIAIVEKDALVGFNVAVGGGMGTTHGDKATYPRLGEVIGFCPPEQLLAVAEQVVAIQRDFGDRANRKHARFKYTLDDRGTEWFNSELAARLGFALAPPRPYAFTESGDRAGWVKDKQGRWHLNLCILSGRIKDTEETAWLTGLRKIAKIHDGDFRLTASQNLIIANVSKANKPKIQALLKEYRIPVPDDWTALKLHAISCVAFPTCGLAMAESERFLPGLLGRLEPLLKKAGLEKQTIQLRVTGCPNGCARPYLGEIALIGKSPGHYNLYLGAGYVGERLNKLYKESLTEDEIIAELAPLIERYGKEREKDEPFGDFLIRAKVVAEVRVGREFHDAP
jgi:sulfite reductase (NADPH) hemoprotein beta-component